VRSDVKKIFFACSTRYVDLIRAQGPLALSKSVSRPWNGTSPSVFHDSNR